MRRAVFVLVVAGCTEPAAELSRSEPAPPSVVPASGDPLLARARASIAQGEMEASVRGEILASDAAVHARARALLAAMDEAAGVDDREDADADGKPLPAVVAPLPQGDDAPIEVAGVVPVKPPPPGSDAIEGATTPAAKVSLPPLPKGGYATLTKLALAPRSGGATLVMEASSGVLVGVASQPTSGLVRLVVESASALPKVLSGRPKLSGVRVTNVQKGKDTVIVTLQLDDGWSYGGVKRTSGGARVELLGPG